MAQSPVVEKLYTPEELEAMPDASGYELIDGVLTERKVSYESSRTAFRIGTPVNLFATERDLGDVLGSDIGLRLWPDRPLHYRRPDVAFVTRRRVTEQVARGGDLQIPPDLIVEVVSPNDLAHEVEEKIREYLDAGVNMIWVVYTEPKSVHVIRRHQSARLTEDDMLSGDDVLPGFECKVADLYPKSMLRAK